MKRRIKLKNNSEFEIKNNVVNHKNNSLNRLDLSFLKHIELKEYKQSDLLAYWINDFSEYHDEEKTFDTTKMKTFKRGDIIKVNLGYNIGNELGGLHYCVVINKFDNPFNGTLNVIPLTSKKENKKYHKSCVSLGSELYNILSANIEKENNKLNNLLSELDKLDNIPEDFQEAISKKMKYLEKLGNEINKLKLDSIALITQITTISKQRIYDDIILRKVRLSTNSLNVIDKKINYYFTNQKERI